MQVKLQEVVRIELSTMGTNEYDADETLPSLVDWPFSRDLDEFQLQNPTRNFCTHTCMHLWTMS
jgi:hypothetical protein